MAYRSGMFNSVGGDRKYQALHFAEYFATFIGNGVFPNPSNGLQVYAKENMTVTVKPGKAWINGYYFVNDSDCDLALDISDGVLNRIDRIVLRFDTATRQIVPSVRKGAFSASPTAPVIQRDADGYEISLAQIKIVKGALAIGQGAILDERLDKTVCGIVHGTVDQVDTTTIFNQYQAWFNETTSGTETEIETWKENQYQNFADWFATIQGILEGDVAANLASMISALTIEVNNHKNDNTAHGIGDKTQLLTTEKTSIVGAMNELFTNADDGKTVIANAIVGKGGTASKTDTFGELATAINNISTGKKFATGNFKGSGTSKNTFSTNANFTIRLLIIYWYNENQFYRMVWDKNNNPTKDNWFFSDHITYTTSDRIDGGKPYQNAIVVSNNLVTLTCGFVGTANVSWEAFE